MVIAAESCVALMLCIVSSLFTVLAVSAWMAAPFTESTMIKSAVQLQLQLQISISDGFCYLAVFV